MLEQGENGPVFEPKQVMDGTVLRRPGFAHRELQAAIDTHVYLDVQVMHWDGERLVCLSNNGPTSGMQALYKLAHVTQRAGDPVFVSAFTRQYDPDDATNRYRERPQPPMLAGAKVS